MHPLQVALFQEGTRVPVWTGTLHEFCEANEYDQCEITARFTPGTDFIRLGGGAAPEFKLLALGW